LDDRSTGGKILCLLKSAIPTKIRLIIDLRNWKGKEDEKRGCNSDSRRWRRGRRR
jgi:hypothetical protein